MEPKTASAKEVGRSFLKTISMDNVVIHPPKKPFADTNVVTLDCAIHSGGERYLFSIQVKNHVLKTARSLSTRVGEIISALKSGEVNFAYATIGDKTMLYLPDSYRLYAGAAPHVTEIYDVHDDILLRLEAVRDLLVACYEKQPQMILLE